MAYIIHIAIIIGIFAILTVSLNLTIGFTGLLNLAHIAFFGIGAYTSAILVMKGIPFFASFIAAGVFAAMFGLLLIALTQRLQGDYFALATLGFAFVTHSLLLNLDSITRGPLGIVVSSNPRFFRVDIVTNFQYLIYVLIVLSLVLLLLYKIGKSRYGKVLQAVRDDEIGAQALGKNVKKIKYQSVMLSAAMAGIAGSLFAHYIGFIDPATFYLYDLIIILTIVIVGGLASTKGSVLATILLIILPELLRFLPLPHTAIGPLRLITYAAILIAVLMYKPRGLFGKVDFQ